MSALSDYMEGEVTDLIFEDNTTLYVALHTDDPSNDGGNNEVSAGDYDRVSTDTADWDVSGNNPRVAQYEDDLLFPQAESNWGTITHFSVWDGSGSGDNCLFWDKLDEDVTINEDEQYESPEGDFEFEIS